MKNVLIVEDDTLIGMLLETMLQELDFNVCGIAVSEDDAVEAALRLRPDVIVVDARLGAHGSGIAAMARIQTHFTVPHIFISGDRLGTASLGARCLLKPFNEIELTRAMADVFQN